MPWLGRMLRGASEAVWPTRLGQPFRVVLASSWISNLGDGIAMAAGPLLMASLTSDAQLVALAAGVQWLPPLLFSLLAGVVTDRVSRRGVLIIGNALRVLVLLGLGATIVTGIVSVPIVLALMFLLGSSEVFVDNTSSTLVPSLVARDDIGTANARVMFGIITLNRLVGPPIGAALFVVGAVWPFGLQAIGVALAVVLLTRLRLPTREPETRRSVGHELREGMRWVWSHAAVRTLVITIFVFNVTFGAAWSVLVLYASTQLGLGAVGFGLITTVGAVGGIVGTLAYGWLARRLRLGTLMRIGLAFETLTHIALALTHIPWVAMAIFFVFGAHESIWGTTSTTIRQRAVPAALQGRVSGVYAFAVFGGLVIGSLLGGFLAERSSIATPFWVAGIGSALLVAVMWRQLRHVALSADDDA